MSFVAFIKLSVTVAFKSVGVPIHLVVTGEYPVKPAGFGLIVTPINSISALAVGLYKSISVSSVGHSVGELLVIVISGAGLTVTSAVTVDALVQPFPLTSNS